MLGAIALTKVLLLFLSFCFLQMKNVMTHAENDYTLTLGLTVAVKLKREESVSLLCAVFLGLSFSF